MASFEFSWRMFHTWVPRSFVCSNVLLTWTGGLHRCPPGESSAGHQRECTVDSGKVLSAPQSHPPRCFPWFRLNPGKKVVWNQSFPSLSLYLSKGDLQGSREPRYTARYSVPELVLVVKPSCHGKATSWYSLSLSSKAKEAMDTYYPPGLREGGI